MTEGNGFTAKIEMIEPNSRQVALNGRWYPLGDKINLQWFKVGDMVEEVKVTQAGIIVFMRKQKAGTVPPPPLPAPTGFIPANQIQPPAPEPYKKKPDQNTMLWCNSVNSAIEVLKIQWEGQTFTDLQTQDMWDQVIAGASKFYSAGMARMVVHE